MDFVLIVTLHDIFYITLISQNDKFYFLIKPRFIYNRDNS